MPYLPGPFVSTTSIFDTIDIRTVDINSDQFKQFLVLLYQQVNNHAIQLNSKVHGWYSLQAYSNGRQFPPVVGGNQNRGVGSKMIFFGALPAVPGVTKTVAHNITFNADTRIIWFWCTANNTVAQTAINVPYVDVLTAGAQNTQISLDNTNINITSNANMSAFNETYVYIEYTT